MSKLFLTRSETLRVKAYQDYKKRDLTKTEFSLLHLVRISKLPAGSNKDIEVASAIKFMKGNEVRDFIIDRVNECANNPVELDKLLEAYPHVKYHDVIGNFEALSGYERIQVGHHFPIGLDQMKKAAEWIIKAHIFFNMIDTYIPSNVETYISTNYTDYDRHRQLWTSTKDKKHLGYILPKVIQAEVGQMFNYADGLRRDLDVIISTYCHDLPDLFKRVGLQEVYDLAKVPGLEIIFPNSHKGGGFSNNLWMGSNDLVTLSLVHKEHGNAFHFQL